MPSDRRSSNLACATTRHELPVVTPYRLDPTVSALRRLASNRVDVYTADGRYLRALDGFKEPVVVCVTQSRPDVLEVAVAGTSRHEPVLAIVRRILGTERDVADFDRRARRMPWLTPLARRMRGLKPPRYPTLWEACVNTIVYQQISLQAASSVMRRLIHLLSDSVEYEGVSLAIFPTVERFLGAPEAAIRAVGISAAKLAALRRAGEAIVSGALSEAMIEERSIAEGARLLCAIKGIGPCTAAVILIRGFARLDTFPGNPCLRFTKRRSGSQSSVATRAPRQAGRQGRSRSHAALRRCAPPPTRSRRSSRRMTARTDEWSGREWSRSSSSIVA